MSKIKTIQDLHNAVKAIRRDSFDGSEQLTLGDLRDLLKDIPTEYGSDKEDVTVVFDFGTAYPTGFSSWRGSYDELAINYALSGYDQWEGKDNMWGSMKLKDFKELIDKTLGETMEGWKGGDFTMTEKTPVWVANDGNVGNTGVVGILSHSYCVTILTKYCEY